MPVMLCCVLIFVLWFKYERDKSSKISNENSAKYWDLEYKSNFVRKKDIESLNYIKIPLDKLPFMETDDPKINSLQDIVTSLSSRRIVNLTGLTNTELKLKYGAANLTHLTEYDENYTLLVRTLYQWGSYLYEHNYQKESISILEYGISLRTDVSGNYKLLARIYKNKGDNRQIQSLIDQAGTIPSLLKSHIIAALTEILEE